MNVGGMDLLSIRAQEITPCGICLKDKDVSFDDELSHIGESSAVGCPANHEFHGRCIKTWIQIRDQNQEPQACCNCKRPLPDGKVQEIKGIKLRSIHVEYSGNGKSFRLKFDETPDEQKDNSWSAWIKNTFYHWLGYDTGSVFLDFMNKYCAVQHKVDFQELIKLAHNEKQPYTRFARELLTEGLKTFDNAAHRQRIFDRYELLESNQRTTPDSIDEQKLLFKYANLIDEERSRLNKERFACDFLKNRTRTNVELLARIQSPQEAHAFLTTLINKYNPDVYGPDN